MREGTAKLVNGIVNLVLFTIIPVFTIYLSRSNTIPTLFPHLQPSEVSYYQDLCFVLGTLVNLVLLVIKLNLTEIQMPKVVKQRNEMLKLSKKFFMANLSQEFRQLRGMDVEIYILYTDMWSCLKNGIECATLGHVKFQKYFVPIDGLASNQLRWQVYPQPEGLIGQCCVRRAAGLDDGTNRLLTNYQKNIVSNWKFWLCVPDFDDITDEVVMIVSLSCDKKVNLPPDRLSRLSEKMVCYARDLKEGLLDKRSANRSMRV